MAKGGGYEREVCYQLSRWWTGNPKELVFWRTANSGGATTVRHRKGIKSRAHAGDITATEPTAVPLTHLITLELKRGYNRGAISHHANLHELIDRLHGAPQLFEQFIVQAKTAAKTAGTPYWMIIHRRDHHQAVCYMPSRLYAELSVLGCFRRPPVPFLAMTVKVRGGGSETNVSVVGMLFEWFLGAVDPEDVLAVLNRRKGD